MSQDPQDEVVRREEISLAFVAALQLLAPRQRAALLLHDVLGFSHAEVAEVLEVSTAAVNSLLSRARESVRARAGQPQPDITEPRVQQLLRRYVRAWQLADIDAFVRLVTEDVRFIMPPLTAWFDGREAVAAFVENAIFGPPARTGCSCGPAPATGSRRSRPISQTVTATLSSAASRSCSSARWMASRSSPRWCPIATPPSRSAADCRPRLPRLIRVAGGWPSQTAGARMPDF